MRSETIDDWDNIKEADGDDSSDDGAVIESRQRVATVLFSADNASVTRRGRPAPSASAPAPESIQIVTTTSYEQGFGNARKEKMDDEAEDLFGSVHRHSDSLGLSSNVREASASKLSAPPSDPLEHLARLQSFDGCFSPAVFAFAGIDVQMLRVMFPAGAGDGIIATVLAMAFLSTKLGADVDRESWEGMYEKAKEYVEEALMGISANESVDWLEAEVVKMLA
ncbi:hypothetical protein B0H19DRAFT_1171756 [Mycena capillaripes]|nr:hypothetical protein B0H19DRAFT_1171756 [Mycena capillaripes]